MCPTISSGIPFNSADKLTFLINLPLAPPPVLSEPFLKNTCLITLEAAASTLSTIPWKAVPVALVDNSW